MSDMVALRAHPIPAETTPPSHAEIAAGVAEGQRWAHAALYDMLYPVVARTLQKILHETSPDYEDLVQTSFERIVRTLAVTSSPTRPSPRVAAWTSTPFS